ncbi:MAG: acetyl-CoA hydrolase [Ruminococcaceae bacterium]|nr:acetyl-CoA hydrolase [Oscillospiraceae bacterium]
MERIAASLKDRILSAEEAAAMILPRMVLGCSGFSRVGYPKAIPRALAAQGRADGLTVITGASVGAEMDGEMVKAGLIARRYPYQNDKALRTAVNAGALAYNDAHLSHLPLQLERGAGPQIDFAIVECAAITDEGILPPASLGIMDTVIRRARKILVEVNDTIPLELAGMHDICSSSGWDRSFTPVLSTATDRIGTALLPYDRDKIAGIVLTSDPGSFFSFSGPDENTAAIARHIVSFLKNEVSEGRLPRQLPPIQSGTGSVANGVLAGLSGSGFTGLQMYSEVFQDSALQLMDEGKMIGASATALTFSRETTEHFYKNLEQYRQKLVIRPQGISNNPIAIRSLGVISINTALECDIYGNVNSSHQLGRSMMNGIGGSGDFARNAAISIFSTLSTAKNGAISCLVPMVSHVDHTEHDVQVIVTEQGLADLRWKSPRERAECIIENCAHPDYRPMLREYFREACLAGGHTPHCLDKALAWHLRFADCGSMKPADSN